MIRLTIDINTRDQVEGARLAEWLNERDQSSIEDSLWALLDWAQDDIGVEGQVANVHAMVLHAEE